jgi:hypothetical protein
LEEPLSSETSPTGLSSEQLLHLLADCLKFLHQIINFPLCEGPKVVQNLELNPGVTRENPFHTLKILPANGDLEGCTALTSRRENIANSGAILG